LLKLIAFLIVGATLKVDVGVLEEDYEELVSFKL
jgi:hypothetical protein